MSALVRRLVIAVVGVLAVVYLAGAAIWISPGNIVRHAMFSTLQPIYNPHVAQAWGLFAKGMVNSDKTIIMRAVIEGPQGRRTTGWVDLGPLEWDNAKHTPEAPRESRTVFKLAGQIQGAYPRVPRALRDAIEGSTTQPGGPDLVAIAKARGMSLSGQDRNAISNWEALEVTTRGLMSLYAYHFWGRPVVEVQWQTVITPVTRFDDRGTDDRPAPARYNVGWRAAASFPPEVWAAWR